MAYVKSRPYSLLKINKTPIENQTGNFCGYGHCLTILYFKQRFLCIRRISCVQKQTMSKIPKLNNLASSPYRITICNKRCSLRNVRSFPQRRNTDTGSSISPTDVYCRYVVLITVTANMSTYRQICK